MAELFAFPDLVAAVAAVVVAVDPSDVCFALTGVAIEARDFPSFDSFAVAFDSLAAGAFHFVVVVVVVGAVEGSFDLERALCEFFFKFVEF